MSQTGPKPHVAGPPDESELARRCCAGDDQAWKIIHNRYFPLIRRAAVRYWGWSEDEAEDIAQGALLRLCESLHKYRGHGSLHGFIMRIARCYSLDQIDYRLARRRRAERLATALEELEKLGIVPLQDPSARSDLSCEELVRQFRATLETLEAPCNELLRLRYRDHLSYKEMAHLRGVQVGTLASQLSRCVAQLAEVLGVLDVEESVMERAALFLEEDL